MDEARPEFLRGGGAVCWIGLGNVHRGDDGFGVRLAEALARDGHPHAIAAGTSPERWVETASAGGFAHVVFLDAVDGPGEPGTTVILPADELEERFPQVSTHRIALGTLARIISGRGPRVWLLGVKPASLGWGEGLSEPVCRALGRWRTLAARSLEAPVP